MTLRAVLVPILAALLGSVLTVATFGSGAQAQPRVQQFPGRYQAVEHGSTLLLIDTATGEGWEEEEHTLCEAVMKELKPPFAWSKRTYIKPLNTSN